MNPLYPDSLFYPLLVWVVDGKKKKMSFNLSRPDWCVNLCPWWQLNTQQYPLPFLTTWKKGFGFVQLRLSYPLTLTAVPFKNQSRSSICLAATLDCSSETSFCKREYKERMFLCLDGQSPHGASKTEYMSWFRNFLWNQNMVEVRLLITFYASFSKPNINSRFIFHKVV